MTAIQVSMTFCAISFVLMFASIGRLIWRTYRETRREDTEPSITLTRSELEDIIKYAVDYAVNRILEAVKKQEEAKNQ